MTAEEFLNSLPNLAEALRKINDFRAMDGLIAALDDSDSYVRGNAIRALGNLKSTKPLELLIYKLQDPEPSVRRASATALGKIGCNRAIEALISQLQDADPITRWCCAEALGNIGVEEAIEPLIIALQDEHIMVQKTVIVALGQIGSDIAIESLKKFLKHSESSLRKQAILAITRIKRMKGEQPLIQPLLFALNDNEPKIRQLAAQKLLSETTHFGKFPQSLLNGLQHSSVTVRIESIKFLGSMTTDNLKDLGVDLVVDALITRLLEDNSLTVKRFAANSLGQIGHEKAIAPLISVLQDRSEHLRVRRSTIYALEQIGTEQIFQPLILALKDPISYVRTDVASVLSRIAGDWAIKDLVASLSDKKWRVRHNSCQVLEKIGGIKVEEELLNTLSNFTITPRHRRTIFFLLPKVGDKKSFDTLIFLLTHSYKSVRSEAATAIGLFAHKRQNIDYINRAVEPLISSMSQSQALVRNAAIIALSHIAIHHQCKEENRASIILASEIAKNDRNYVVRNHAICALTTIPRKDMFNYLIKELDRSDIWTAKQAIEGLGKMIHDQTATKLAKFPLTDTQIDLAMEKLEQASKNSNWLISKPAKKMLAQLKTN